MGGAGGETRGRRVWALRGFVEPRWLPGWLSNHWLQFALVTPVMFWAGWPIQRTGWLTLKHRTADVNTLITVGTSASFGFSLLVTVAPGVLPSDQRETAWSVGDGQTRDQQPDPVKDNARHLA